MIEKKIIAKEFNNDPNDIVYWYHHFILESQNDMLLLDIMISTKNDKKTRKEMKHFTLCFRNIPEYLNKIITAFYATSMDDTSHHFEFDDMKYSIIAQYDFNRTGEFNDFYLSQKQKNDIMQKQSITLSWNNVKISWHDNPRILPESLAWLIDNLKKVYNEWQKNHPEHPPISD